MPLRSVAQAIYLKENKPELYERFKEHTTESQMARLPQRLEVPKKKRRANMKHVRTSMRRSRRLRNRRG